MTRVFPHSEINMEGDSEAHISEEVQSRSTRCNTSSASNAARQMAVNFMPSRQLPYNTLRHRRNNSENNGLLDETDTADDGEDEDRDPSDKQANIIVKELEQHHHLMEDSPVSEELRREALRDLPQGLTMKRNVRAKLSASVSLRSKRRPISVFKRTKYRISFAWKRSKERIRDALFSIELWYEAIRSIEGQFGSAVGSYFRMVRRLFLLDLALAVLLLAFVVVPQSRHDVAVRSNATDDDQRIGIIYWLTDVIGLERTLMFYGHYHDGYIEASLPYNMAFAYFFTMLSLYLVFFAFLCYSTAYSYRRHFIETAGGVSHVFANKLFCGWDFTIVSEHAASLNARSIYNELQELLNEQNNKQDALSFCTKCWHVTMNVTISILVLTSIGGILCGLWKLLEVLLPHIYWELLVTVLLIVVVTVCPLMFHLVARLEYYAPRTALYVTLCRTWLLDVSILLLLFIFWSRSETECWETRFGQEMYRLVLLDAVVSLLVLPAIEIIRALMYKLKPKGSPPEFNIAYNSLTLIYNQSVLWFGMLFSPLLPVAVTIKFLFLFYVKRECAFRACQPARKVWRAAQTQTVLYMLVTLSLFTTLFGIGSLFLKMSSASCGPFRAYSRVYGVLTEGALRLHARPALRATVGWLARPAPLAALVLLLGAAVYYSRARARAQQAMVRLLRHMLLLQAKDKDFLLTAIEKVSNGEWLYSPKPSAGENSHTYRYMREVRQPSNSSFHLRRSRECSRLYECSPRDCSRTHDGDSDSSFSWRGDGED